MKHHSSLPLFIRYIAIFSISAFFYFILWVGHIVAAQEVWVDTATEMEQHTSAQ